MRKIRFRIWDGTTYFYPEANRKASNHYLQFGSEGFWLYNSDGKLVASTTEEDICEQFTGLKDKNGREIYESDIFDNNEVVIFSQSEACYFLGQSPLSMSNSHREIIGNIHENPAQ